MINMGFRFRKSFKAGPFRATISKSGISTSFGVKGARITKKANGNTMSTVGIPGTGLSYVSETSNKSKKKTKAKEATKMTSNSYVPYEQKHFSNYTEYTDPQTADAPRKPKFMGVMKNIGIFIAIMFAILIAAVIVDTPALIGFGLIGVIIWACVKGKKWRKSYMLLREPVSFEKWQDYINSPNMFSYVRGNLTNEQFMAYINIVNYCGGTDKVFTPAEFNAAKDSTTSSYMFNKLYEFGYLVKPARGKYALNMDKVNYMTEMYEKAQAGKKARYDAFIKECETYNENARIFNSNLIKSRQPKQ